MERTVELYIEKSKRYLIDADLLLKSGSPESVVSRAYYAMFYLAKALLFNIEVYTKTHQGTLMMFSKHFVKTEIFEKKYGNIMSKALDQRIVGDYEIGHDINQDLATEILQDAHEFVETAINYLEKNTEK